VTAAARGDRSAGAALDPGLSSLLEYLKRNRGFDFTGYKRSSLQRRIRKRMEMVGVGGYEEYQDYLEVTPDEYTELFNTILINVTGFFRDKPAWDYVAEEIVPPLLEEIPPQEQIRVWSAACATGEEAYTIAIILAEALGEKAFRRRVKVYATDVDEDALSRARQAVYPSAALKPVPDDLAEKYFERRPTGWTFRTDLRRSVIFGRNDLVEDAPISRIDLLVSRNALMYFTPETQASVLRHFNFALKDTGFLFLGKSEMLITHKDLFTPHDLKWRVFRKVPGAGLRDRLAFVTDQSDLDSGRYSELLLGAFDIADAASVVVDRGGFLTRINQAARVMFGLGPSEIGRPFHDLDLSYRPVDLRSALEQAYLNGSGVQVGRVPWTTAAGGMRTLDVSVTPVIGPGGRPLGATISFADATRSAQVDEEYERSKLQLETAYEELQSTVEELETTNEELHSTNEELETTNEELQSSNEELETMNEELQSTNDELETMNDEQVQRSTELDRVNLFLEGILSSVGVGVAVVDNDQRVQVWNGNAEEQWGLRADEVEGQHFLGLDIGLPVERLKNSLRKVLSDGEEVQDQVPAVTRRGRSVECLVRTMPLRRPKGEIYGALVLMAVDGDRPLGGD
jgi:two-component system, chemotaxis family, CheB/CheR fusion protein